MKAGLKFALALAAMSLGTAQAQETDDFYANNDITLVVGFNSGGAYDLYARTLARHMGKHIPGEPQIIVQNMPGGGSVIAANHLYNRSPRDGSEIGMVAGTTALDPLYGVVPTQFDSQNFTWIGSAEESLGVCFAWHTSDIETADDLFDKEMITGTAGTDTYMIPAALNSILGTRMQLIMGYAGSAGMLLALEQGEVDGVCGMIYAAVQSQRPDWLEQGLVRTVIQFGLNRSEKLPDVPSAFDYITDDEQRQLLQLLVGWSIMGRPFVAPPDLPESRRDMLRQAFDATMSDPEFLADAERQRLDVSPATAEEIEAYLLEAFATPEAIVEQARQLIAEGQ